MGDQGLRLRPGGDGRGAGRLAPGNIAVRPGRLPSRGVQQIARQERGKEQQKEKPALGGRPPPPAARRAPRRRGRPGGTRRRDRPGTGRRRLPARPPAPGDPGRTPDRPGTLRSEPPRPFHRTPASLTSHSSYSVSAGAPNDRAPRLSFHGNHSSILPDPASFVNHPPVPSSRARSRKGLEPLPGFRRRRRRKEKDHFSSRHVRDEKFLSRSGVPSPSPRQSRGGSGPKGRRP